MLEELLQVRQSVFDPLTGGVRKTFSRLRRSPSTSAVRDSTRRSVSTGALASAWLPRPSPMKSTKLASAAARPTARPPSASVCPAGRRGASRSPPRRAGGRRRCVLLCDAAGLRAARGRPGLKWLAERSESQTPRAARLPVVRIVRPRRGTSRSSATRRICRTRRIWTRCRRRSWGRKRCGWRGRG